MFDDGFIIFWTILVPILLLLVLQIIHPTRYRIPMYLIYLISFNCFAFGNGLMGYSLYRVELYWIGLILSLLAAILSSVLLKNYYMIIFFAMCTGALFIIDKSQGAAPLFLIAYYFAFYSLDILLTAPHFLKKL